MASSRPGETFWGVVRRVWPLRRTAVDFGPLGGIVQKVKVFANYSVPVISGIVSFALGFFGAFLLVGRIWTHVFTRPDTVTAFDFYAVVAIAAAAGIVLGAAAVKFSAKRFWVSGRTSRPAHA